MRWLASSFERCDVACSEHERQLVRESFLFSYRDDTIFFFLGFVDHPRPAKRICAADPRNRRFRSTSHLPLRVQRDPDAKMSEGGQQRRTAQQTESGSLGDKQGSVEGGLRSHPAASHGIPVAPARWAAPDIASRVREATRVGVWCFLPCWHIEGGPE